MAGEGRISYRDNFRPDLQGLRAIAILLVVLAHAGIPWLEGGFVGVDIFFVLSGYLITGLLLRELEQTGRIKLISFYARRLRRLLPALVVMVMATVALAYVLLSPYESMVQLASAPYASTWTSNLYFIFSTVDYFEELAARDLFLHTWSLGVEEQFYLLWPLLLLALFVGGPMRRPAGRPQATAAVLGCVALASFALSAYMSARWPFAAFYSMPTRIWQFALGGMVYIALEPAGTARCPGSAIRTLSPGTSRVALALGLLLTLGSGLGLAPHVTYPGFWALPPTAGAVLIIMSGYGLSAGHAGPLAHRSMVWLGDRSYSLYLWHWPILTLGFSLGYEGQVIATLALILLSLLAAIFSYRFVELPFWKGRMNVASARHALAAGALIMVGLVGISTHSLATFRDMDEAIAQGHRWRVDLPEIYRRPCDAGYEHARVEPCKFGEANAERTVVLLGDSIGVQWFSMVREIFPSPEWLTVVLTKSACAMVDEDYYYARIRSNYDVCSEWRNSVLERLELIRPDVVIVGSSAGYEFSESQWVYGSKRVLDRLTRSAGTVLLIPGTPTLGFDGPSCLGRQLASQFGKWKEPCTAIDRLERTRSVSRYLGQAAQQFPNAHLLDLNDLTCPGEVCSAMGSDGIAIFRDSQHLTDSFVRAQVPVVREYLNSFLLTVWRHD